VPQHLGRGHRQPQPFAQPARQPVAAAHHLRVGTDARGVEERRPVHVGDVDPHRLAGDHGVRGVLRRLEADVAGEVVQRARGDDGERQAVLDRDRGGRGDAAVPAGHPERLRPAGRRRLTEQLDDPCLLGQLQHLGAGQDALDVRDRVVVVGTGARVDRHHEAVPLGQRRSLGRRAHPRRLLGPHAPPVLGGGRDGAADGEPGHDVAGVVDTHVHP
jgi:hypothetical protein